MNDWDNLDKFPPDDEEPDFSWLNEDDNDLDWLNSDSEETPEADEEAPHEWQMPRPSKAERDIAAQMEEAEAADFGNEDELLDWMAETDEIEPEEKAPDLGVPDWLMDMDLPEASEEEISAAQASIRAEQASDFDDFEWMDEEESPDKDLEGVSSDSILFGSRASDDADDSFLFGTVTSDDEADSFLFGTSASHDEEDDFLFGTGAGSTEDDDFIFGTSTGDEDELIPSKASDSAAPSEWGVVGSSWTGEMPAVPDEEEETETQGFVVDDSDDEDFGVGIPLESQSPAARSGWEVSDDEDFGADDPAFASLFGTENEESAEDIGIPDWLMGIDEASPSESDDLDFAMETAPNTGDSGLDDLLGALDTDDDDDLGALLADLDDSEEADVDELLAALGDSDDEELELESLLADLGTEETEARDDSLDFLMEMGEESPSSDDLDFLEPVTNQVDDLDFLEPVLADNADDNLDFLTEFVEASEEIEIQPEAELEAPVVEGESFDLDFLAELTGETSDDLDLLEPVADTSSDLDFLGEGEGFYQEGVEADLDFFDNLEAEQGDWFEETEATPADNLDFLDAIPEGYQEEEPIAEAANEDWLSSLDNLDESAFQEEKREIQPSMDIDALIDSFGTIEDDEEEVALPAADLDAIFGALGTSDSDKDGFSEGEIPEWLREVAEDVDENSAVALIRQRRDRSLDDLDERLLALRESGLVASEEGAESPEEKERLNKLVPNLEEALVPVRVQANFMDLVTEPSFSAEQRQRAELLTSLMESQDQQRRRNPLAGVQSALRSVRISRWMIILLLVAAVLAPFTLSNMGFDEISILPPYGFETESPEYSAFNLIENLEPEQEVLVAAEYGATGARELDTATRAILEHIFVNGAKPVIVSSDAIGLLRAENLTEAIAGVENRNRTYYIAGYLIGGTLGLRDFALNVNLTVNSDSNGQPTGLTINSLDEFEAIVLIAENGETVRNWMEQIAPLTSSRIIVITGQAARPLALPYVSAVPNALALLTGYDDAFTYQQMALGRHNPSPTATFTATNTPTATSTPPPTDTPTATYTPTNTPLVSDTPTATDTATSSPTPTGIPMIQVATVTSANRVNVRAGAGPSFEAVGGAEPGERLRVIEASSDGEWWRVVLADGTQGWIAASLVTVEEIPESEWDGANKETYAPVFYSLGRRSIQQDATATPDVLEVGINGAGGAIEVFADATSNTVIGSLENRDEIIILGPDENGRTFVRMGDGSEGYIVTMRISQREFRLRSEIPFAPTLESATTPEATETETLIPPTVIPSPSPMPTAFVPVVTPTNLENPEVRTASQTMGLLAAIVIISIGNVIWIVRWLRQRES